MTRPEPLSADVLCWLCDPASLGFQTTDELEDLGEVIGQGRAVEAIHFAAGMARPGYNLFALGPEGTGKHTVVRQFLEDYARQKAPPDDWCYISNFKQRRAPRALKLSAGQGATFQADMARFVDEVKDALRSAFESDEYRNRRQIIEEELKEHQEQAVGEIEQAGRAQGIALLRTPVGFAFAPLSEGKVVAPEAFQQFPEAERNRIEAEIEELQKRLQAILQETPIRTKEMRGKLRALNDETALFAVSHLIAALRAQYDAVPEVLTYLDDVQRDVVDNVAVIVAGPERPGLERQGADGVAVESEDGHPLFRRYRVNLIVDNGGAEQAPVVYEDDPTYDRLLGRIEHRAEMGTLITDFHLVRPGAVHRANGGYLILDARKLLTRPMAWEGLKRALLAGVVRIESLAQALGTLSTVSLEPEPIPLDVKVVIVGERQLYYQLAQLDPEFSRLFKVAADFDEQIVRSAENNLLYARLVASVARNEELRPIACGGVARALEYSARQAGDGERLSMHIESLADLLREADYWAGQTGRATIGAAKVQHAVDSQIRRLDRVRERMQDEIVRGTIMIDTEGAAPGQVNGLAVLQIGGYAFGRASRITAAVRLGRGEVVDIEREVKLGGPLHSKGVLILSGYLSTRYAAGQPLSLAASLVFEQSYGGIDGDSASSAELYTLLSAIAEVPLRQGLAVTGSVNQHGAVQAIGGVNEKIEGFFDLCAERGLTGDQGVLIPATNVKHLMVHRRVVDAVRRGEFHIYPITTIDQGIEILSGTTAGERGPDGAFPEASFNRRVEQRLLALAELRQAFGRPSKSDGDE